ncbi:MAG: hypothetical protein ACRDJG_05840 [Actinomycetota bacterium]
MPTRFYRYRLTLGAPLIVPTLEGDPNSVRSAIRIPGSAVRGAVAARLGASHPRFRELVLSREVRYLNAYPLPEGAGGRSIPCPLAWRVEKYPPGKTHDLSYIDDSRDLPQLEALSRETPYVAAAARLTGVRPLLEMRFHHQRDRILGRATEERGAIFTYEAIAPGASFSGMVAVSGDGDDEVEGKAARIREILQEPLMLGRSRRTQYGGGCPIAWEGRSYSRELEGWSTLLTTGLDPKGRFRFLLTADAIVRDPQTGQADPARLADTVASALGGRACVLRTLGGATVASAFNTTWRLPLPQSPAAAAGTIVVLEATEPIDMEDLLAVERQGIGERLSEGFGACLFLVPAASPTVAVKPAEERPAPESPPGPLLPASLAAVQERLWKEAVLRGIEREAARLSDGATGIPSRSLLQRLRTPLREGESGLERLATWMGPSEEEMKLRRPAKEALMGCRLPGGKPLDQWLRETLRPSESALDALAHALFRGAALERSTLAESVNDQTQRRLAEGARRELIEAVLALLARRAGRQE